MAGSFLLLAVAGVYFFNCCYARPSLKEQLEKAAGVFVDNDNIHKYNLEKTVFVTAANHGFLNHLMNFYCFVEKLKLKVLVVSLDEEIDKYLASHNSSYIVSYFLGGESGKEQVQTGAASFRSEQFNLMTLRKKHVVLNILKEGYDVMFSDTDVALLGDPFPYLLWKNMDYVHSLNEPCSDQDPANFLKNPEAEGNTGYYFVRSNPRTIRLFEAVLVAMSNQKALDDQTVFWQLMRNRTVPPVVFNGRCKDIILSTEAASSASNNTKHVLEERDKPLQTCVLDTCLFSSGMMRGPARFKYLFEKLKTQNQHPITIHANWLSGNRMKQDTMKTYGFWLSKSNNLGDCSAAQVNGHEEPSQHSTTAHTGSPNGHHSHPAPHTGAQNRPQGNQHISSPGHHQSHGPSPIKG